MTGADCREFGWQSRILFGCWSVRRRMGYPPWRPSAPAIQPPAREMELRIRRTYSSATLRSPLLPISVLLIAGTLLGCDRLLGGDTLTRTFAQSSAAGERATRIHRAATQIRCAATQIRRAVTMIRARCYYNKVELLPLIDRAAMLIRRVSMCKVAWDAALPRSVVSGRAHRRASTPRNGSRSAQAAVPRSILRVQ